VDHSKKSCQKKEGVHRLTGQGEDKEEKGKIQVKKAGCLYQRGVGVLSLEVRKEGRE